jgi:hypothetical protein
MHEYWFFIKTLIFNNINNNTNDNNNDRISLISHVPLLNEVFAFALLLV